MTAVTMTPITPLFANSQYIYYCNGALDLTGNVQNNNSAGFYTGNGPSSTGPALLYANPPNGMTNVPVNSNSGPWNGSSLGLLFNEPVARRLLGQITLTPQRRQPDTHRRLPGVRQHHRLGAIALGLTPNTNTHTTSPALPTMSGNAITPVTSTFTTGAGFDFTAPVVASHSR